MCQWGVGGGDVMCSHAMWNDVICFVFFGSSGPLSNRFRGDVTWCGDMSSRAMSCHVMSCHVMSCRVVSCHVVSCRVVSCRVM